MDDLLITLGEMFSEEISLSEPNGELRFFNDNSVEDLLAIEQLSEHYGISNQEAEEFLGVTQALARSLARFGHHVELSEIDEYISNFNENPRSMVGLISNIKGIYGEQALFPHLQSFYGDEHVILRDHFTNQEHFDFSVIDSEGQVIDRLNLMVSSDHNYILNARDSLPRDVKIITTTEAIENIIARHGHLPYGILGVELSNEAITGSVERTINILQNTEPEFDLLIQDPVVSEYLSQGVNPFEVGADQSVGRSMYADWQEREPTDWTYSSYVGSEFNLSDIIDNTIDYRVEWDMTAFEGFGCPASETAFWTQQQADQSCAIVAQRNILESFGVHSFSESELTEIALERNYYHPDFGTPLYEMASLLRGEGLVCVDMMDASITDIESALANNSKVLVGVNANEIWFPLRDIATGEAVEQPIYLHCVQVTGVYCSNPEETLVILSDPGHPQGEALAVSKADFINAWEKSSQYMVQVKEPS